MNRTIALPYLAAELAEKNSVSTDIAERFVVALVDIVSEALSRGEQVKIKHIGTFTATPLGKIIFTPESAVAETVNAPFSAFAPEILADGVSFETPAEIETETETEPTELIEDIPEPESEVEAVHEPTPEPEVMPEPEPVVESETVSDTESESIPEPEPELQPHPKLQPEPQTVYYEEDTKQYPWVWTITGLVFGVIIGFMLGYFLQPKVDEWIAGNQASEPLVSEVEEEIPSLPTDTIIPDARSAETEQPTQAVTPEAKVVYDTIRTNRFLTTMARQHYGQMEYWVYIYMENADILGNPDRSRPGTVVRIPDLKKYIKSGSDSLNIERAKAKAAEIYAPYR